MGQGRLGFGRADQSRVRPRHAKVCDRIDRDGPRRGSLGLGRVDQGTGITRW